MTAFVIAVLVVVVLCAAFWAPVVAFAIAAWAFAGMVAMSPPVFFGVLLAAAWFVGKCLEEEDGTFATIGLIAGVLWGSMYFGGPIDMLSLIDLETGLMYAGGFVVTGVLYAIYRFWRLGVKKFKQFDEWKENWKTINKGDLVNGKIEGSAKKKFFADISSYYGRHYVTIEQLEKEGVVAIAPRAKDHKGKFLAWSICWPISATFYLLNDPLRRLFTEIFNHLSGFLQRVLNSTFRKGFNDVN